MNSLERYAHIISLFEMTPWALPYSVMQNGIQVLRAALMQDASDRRMQSADMRDNMEHMNMQAFGRRFDRYSSNPEERILGSLGVQLTDAGTAIIPMHGVIAKRMSSFGMSERGTSSDMLADAFGVAAAHPTIRAVVLDIDSPGGSVLGIEDAAQALDHLRSVKTVRAIANDVMASAAVYVGAHTSSDQLFSTSTAIVGSIGVYSARIDRTKYMEGMGVDVHLIAAGKHKLEGHPDIPFSEEERERIQSDVDTYYNMFKVSVMRARGISQKDVDELADGSIEIGENAVRRGFVDGITSLRALVQDTDKKLSSSRVYSTNNGASAMSVFGKMKSDEKSATLTPSADVDERSEIEAQRAEIEAERRRLEEEKAAIAADRKKAEEAAAERERALQTREVGQAFTDLAERVTSAQRKSLEPVALHLRASGAKVTVEGEDGPQEVDAYTALMDGLRAQPKTLDLAERTNGKTKAADVNAATDVAAIQARIAEIQKEKGCSVEEAFAIYTAAQAGS